MNTTPKQLEILRLIYEYQTERGYSPTYAELAKRIKVSTITIFEHMEALDRKGLIRRRRHEARSVEITDLGMVEVGKQARKDDREAVLLRVRAAAKKYIYSGGTEKELQEAIEDSEKIIPEITAPEIPQEGAPT